jgi:hypothetical protein
MANFIVITSSENLHKLIPEKFGKSCYRLEDNNWLISYDGTSKQLCDDLGASNGEEGNIVVLSFSGYWGWAGQDVWDWINVHSR